MLDLARREGQRLRDVGQSRERWMSEELGKAGYPEECLCLDPLR